MSNSKLYGNDYTFKLSSDAGLNRVSLFQAYGDCMLSNAVNRLMVIELCSIESIVGVEISSQCGITKLNNTQITEKLELVK